MKHGRRALGVAVIGAGVGAQHARAYLATGRCELRWLYDLDAARAGRLIDELGHGACAQRFEQVLEDPAVSVVSIASYDQAHAEQVVAALRVGKHVFVEKPLCRSEEELQAIRQAWVSSGGAHLTSNLVLRAAPLYQWARERIVAGDLGRIYAFDGDYLYGRLHKLTDGWRGAVERYSIMQGGGIHLVDLMLWLTGETPRRVSASGNRICTSGTGFRYHDYQAATFECPSGLIGRITANFGCVHPHQHVVRVFGTQGTFIADEAGARVQMSRDPAAPAQPVHHAPHPSSKGALIPGFIEAIAAGQDSRPATEEQFDVMRICFAADQALASGQPTSVAPR